ncbi:MULTISPECIES: hypothetical protein [unclassified Bradyrhizobium]|uniref:hypothetical protein n=1 Tax=unclassified Bradyrhizobium TaxID=2631580 RepID=UPI0004876532|nr:hypothetical protein [Bradyrhizobium sp. WSM1417]
MKMSLKIRAFLEEPASLATIIAALRTGRAPVRALDTLVTDRFGDLTHGMRRAFGKEVRSLVETLGGQHLRTGAHPVKPQLKSGSTYT